MAAQTVEGLREGERVWTVAPRTEGDRPFPESIRFERSGRVLDALTGRPLEGAEVEVWTEEIDVIHGGYRLIDAARTGVDGRFSARNLDGPLDSGLKTRVRAPGYLTLSSTVSDLQYSLFPVEPDRLPTIRVVDSALRPIPGAWITSTYSCAHDAPAFSVRTGVDGSAQLPEYGLQSDIPELRIRAPGYHAIKYLHENLVFRAEPEKVVVLPRVRPIEFIVREVDQDWEEAARWAALRVLDQEGYQRVVTDEEGLVRLSWNYSDTPRYGVVADWLREIPIRDIDDAVQVPPGVVQTLRFQSFDHPQDLPRGSVVLEWPGDLPSRGLEIHLLHADGWKSRVDPAVPTSFPAGEVTLVLGGPFQAIAQEVHHFELGADETRSVPVRLERQPSVRLVEAEPETVELRWIESGFGENLQESRIEWGDELHVPDAPLTVLFAVDGADRILAMPRVREGQVIELGSGIGEPVAPPEVTRPEAEQRIRFVSVPSGRSLTEGISEEMSEERPELRVENDGTFVSRGPNGEGWLRSIRVPGHVRMYARGVYGGEPLTVEVPELARLVLEADFPFRVVGAGGGELDLDQLAPGPLHLVVERDDGARIGLALELGPGEERTLRVQAW